MPTTTTIEPTGPDLSTRISDRLDRAAEVAGQAEAQSARLGGAVRSGAEDVVEEAVDVVEDVPGSGTPYERWTRAELCGRATELDVEGRSGMSEDELIAALRSS